MMYVVRQTRGLGALTAAGIQNCADAVAAGTYWRSPGCWLYSPSAWIQMASLPTPPAPAPPGAPSTVQEETVPGAFTPEQAIAESAAATQAQNLQFFQGVPILADTATGTGLSTTAMIALGLAAGVGLLVVTRGTGRRRRR